MNENLESQNNSSNSFQEIIKNIDENPKNSKKSFLKFSIVLFLIIFLVGGSVLIYKNYFSPEAKQKQNYEKYLKFKANYEKAMSEDVYGGKTPEETLQLFIDALKKEDLDLASKYFVLKENGLPDPKWKEGLIKTKEEGKLKEVINILSKAKPDLKSRISENDYKLIVIENQTIKAYINLEFNPYAKIWKIESL